MKPTQTDDLRLRGYNARTVSREERKKAGV